MCSIAGPGDVVGDVARPERQSHIGVDGRGVPSWWERQVGAKQLVGRFLGEQREMRFVKPERRNFLRVLFGKA